MPRFAAADLAGAERTLELVASCGPDLAERLETDKRLRAVLATVSGASPWMSRICLAYPADALDVLARLDEPTPSEEAVESSAGGGRNDSDSPHERQVRAKQLGILRIAARDLAGYDELEQVTAALSALAARLLQSALDGAEARIDVRRGEPGAAGTAGADGGLAVIGMGKLGAGELNYASDVDVLLVSPHGTDLPELREFLELARSAWRVDLDLRPEGRSGPATRSVASYRAYWRRWADAWEFQALIKASPIAGNRPLGQAFADAAAEQLWEKPISAEDLRRLRELKARSERELYRKGVSDRELKRGPGGIRDIEFALQLLQLVHGQADPTIRVPSTLGAIAALADGGYIAGDDASTLQTAYRFLRTVEHRLQIYEGEQAHSLPTSASRREHLARVLGYRARGPTSAAEQLDTDLRNHRSRVRAIHERLFFRPLLEVFNPPAPTPEADAAPAQLPLRHDAVAVRLAAFGFTDASRTRQAVVELTRGFSRVSTLMQRTLPLLLDWLSEAPDPDGGLLGLRTLADEPLSRDRLVSVCRESPAGARQLCRLLGTTERFARDFRRYPDALRELAGGEFLRRPTREELDRRAASSLAWRSGEGGIETGLRAFAAAERLRIAARDVLAIEDPGPALSDLADAVITAALRHAEPQVPIAVIGMGRLGGRELGHGSDLDLLFVHDLAPGSGPAEAADAADAAVSSFVRLVGGSTPARGVYRIDLSLRPEGRQGPAVRSIGSYAVYYSRWAEPWERQALLRSRFVAGDPAVGRRFATIVGDFVWGRPLGPEEVVDLRRTKARMERERVPAGEDPKFHLKLGPGSLSDVEWTAQLLQLQHGVEAEGTLSALQALAAAGVVSASEESILVESYTFCDRTRNHLNLIREYPSDSLPSAGPQLSVLARSLGYTAGGLRNEYARRTRRARRVVEHLFYGRDDG